MIANIGKSMKHFIKSLAIAASLIAASANAAMPGVPSESQTCKLVGGIFFAVQTMNAAGFNKQEISTFIHRGLKINMPTLGAPPYTDLVIGYAWSAAQKNPETAPALAEQKARADCLEK